MKAIHWRIKVTYNFEKRLTWDDAHLDIAILKDRFFLKKNSRNGNSNILCNYVELWIDKTEEAVFCDYGLSWGPYIYMYVIWAATWEKVSRG